jgi:hypothetical protein
VEPHQTHGVTSQQTTDGCEERHGKSASRDSTKRMGSHLNKQQTAVEKDMAKVRREIQPLIRGKRMGSHLNKRQTAVEKDMAKVRREIQPLIRVLGYNLAQA